MPIPATRPANRAVQVAGFWRRLLASAIDGAILTLVSGLLGLVVALLLHQPLPRVAQLGPDWLLDVALSGGLVAETSLILLGILAFLYFFIFYATRGQTPGKQILDLQVIDGYGERPALGRALLRTLGYLVSALFMLLGFVWIGFDREKRGLHDWLADTYVIIGKSARERA